MDPLVERMRSVRQRYADLREKRDSVVGCVSPRGAAMTATAAAAAPAVEYRAHASWSPGATVVGTRARLGRPACASDVVVAGGGGGGGGADLPTDRRLAMGQQDADSAAPSVRLSSHRNLFGTPVPLPERAPPSMPRTAPREHIGAIALSSERGWRGELEHAQLAHAASNSAAPRKTSVYVSPALNSPTPVKEERPASSPAFMSYATSLPTTASRVAHDDDAAAALIWLDDDDDDDNFIGEHNHNPGDGAGRAAAVMNSQHTTDRWHDGVSPLQAQAMLGHALPAPTPYAEGFAGYYGGLRSEMEESGPRSFHPQPTPRTAVSAVDGHRW